MGQLLRWDIAGAQGRGLPLITTKADASYVLDAFFISVTCVVATQLLLWAAWVKVADLMCIWRLCQSRE